VSLWRESDGVLVLGDVLNNMDVLTGLPGLREPKPYLTPDPAENRRSIRKLAALEPRLVLFGHGAPLRDPDKLRRLVETMPA
jgi:glyoxylase-like metal-dependent hydrolase (beta-lactamase superfamily II)